MVNKGCKKCNTSLSDFYQTGLVGCPDCYIYFRGEIQKAIEEVQEGSFHIGKEPAFSENDRKLFEEYKSKLAEKEKAVINGNFEQVSDLSSEIYMLVEELKKRGIL